MDVAKALSQGDPDSISTIEMHTTGEPVRIIYKGYPELTGTLLDQRKQAKLHHDDIRKRLMLEPRGHKEMYGAILRPSTELVEARKAHIGVLFCHGEGYSTMCGHATIALGRFLLDTHDLTVFPRRNSLIYDPKTGTTTLLLHAPCGIVEVIVPLREDGTGSSPIRPVSFLSVPSFATAVDLPVVIPSSNRWPELGDRQNVTVDIAYGGIFYVLISASELGFMRGLQPGDLALNLDNLSRSTALLKSVIVNSPDLMKNVVHPAHEELSYLYSVMIVDDELGVQAEGTKGVETGLCFFANQQLDRSPTGSCVAARMAVAYAKNKLQKGNAWTYHSVVSNAFGGQGGFEGRIVDVVPVNGIGEGIVVRTEGMAFYTGASTFTVEKGDRLGEVGFDLNDMMSGKT